MPLWEPVSVMRRYDPIYISKYASANDLLNKPVWKQLHCYVTNSKNMNRLLKASNSKQHWNTVKTKFGMNISRDHNEAVIFYANNVSTNWKGDELLKLK